MKCGLHISNEKEACSAAIIKGAGSACSSQCSGHLPVHLLVHVSVSRGTDRSGKDSRPAQLSPKCGKAKTCTFSRITALCAQFVCD